MQDAIQAAPGHVISEVPHLTPLLIFSDATPIIKLIMVLLIVATVAAIAVAVRKALAREGAPRSPFVSNLRLAGPLLGLFGTAYGILNSMIGVASTNTNSLAVIAPGIAEAALTAGLGLLAGTVACITNWVIEARGPDSRTPEPKAPPTRVLTAA